MTTPSLQSLQTLVAEDLIKCNNLIITSINSNVSLVTQLAEHLIQAGGKRLRPMICLAAAKLCDYKGQHHLDLAAAVEFIHVATLLHDDVIDVSLTRRSQKTANALWGNQASILVGDFLFAQAFQLMVQTQSLSVLEVLSKTARILAEGEVWQLTSSFALNLKEADYYRIIDAKTASLFAAAAQTGAILSNASDDVEKALHCYGHSLGMIFQITDDVLDYANTKQTGKNVGDDFYEGKVTLPVILAYQKASAAERSFLDSCWQANERTSDQLAQVQDLFSKMAIFDACFTTAKDYGQKALQVLDLFPNNLAKQALSKTIDFCLERTY